MSKVLVVEDELPLLKAVTKTLEKKEVGTYSASSSKEALNRLRDHNDVDAIWLDHYLLDRDTGLDFLEEIKKEKEWAKIPVFVVTNSVADDKVRRYHLLGVENYYIKSDTSIYKIINDVVDILKIEV